MDESELTSLSNFLDTVLDTCDDVEPLFLRVLRHLPPTEVACIDCSNLMDYATRKHCCIAVPPDSVILCLLQSVEKGSVKPQALAAFCEWHLLLNDPRWQDTYHALPNFNAVVDVNNKMSLAQRLGSGWPTASLPDIPMTFRKRQASFLTNGIHSPFTRPHDAPNHTTKRKAKHRKCSLTLGLSEPLVPISLYIGAGDASTNSTPMHCDAQNSTQKAATLECWKINAAEAQVLVARCVAALSVGSTHNVRDCSIKDVVVDCCSWLRNANIAAWTAEQTTLHQLRLGYQVIHEMRDDAFLRAKLAFRRTGAARTMFGCSARMEFVDLSCELDLINTMFAVVEGEGSIDPWRCCLLLFRTVEGLCRAIADSEGHRQDSHQFVSADSLVPLFTWMLISSNARRPWSTLALCKAALRCARLWISQATKDAALHVRRVLKCEEVSDDGSSSDDEDRDEWYHLVTLEVCLEYIIKVSQ